MFALTSSLRSYAVLAVPMVLLSIFLLPLQILFLVFGSRDIYNYMRLRPDVSLPVWWLESQDSEVPTYSFQRNFWSVPIALISLLVAFMLYGSFRAVNGTRGGNSKAKGSIVLAVFVSAFGFLAAIFMNSATPSWYYPNGSGLSTNNHTRTALMTTCRSALTPQELAQSYEQDWSTIDRLDYAMVCDAFSLANISSTLTPTDANTTYPYNELYNFLGRFNTSLCSDCIGYDPVNNTCVTYQCDAGVYDDRDRSAHGDLNILFNQHCVTCVEVYTATDIWTTDPANRPWSNGSLKTWEFGYSLQVIASILIFWFIFNTVQQTYNLGMQIYRAVYTGSFENLEEDSELKTSAAERPSLPVNPVQLVTVLNVVDILALIFGEVAVMFIARFFILVHFLVPLVCGLYLYEVSLRYGPRWFTNMHAILCGLGSFAALIYFIALVIIDSTNDANTSSVLRTHGRGSTFLGISWFLIVLHWVIMAAISLWISSGPAPQTLNGGGSYSSRKRLIGEGTELSGGYQSQ